jgi:hypothetical protein
VQQKQTKSTVSEVKEILEDFSYPYNRRIAGAHGRFTKKEYRMWLQNAEKPELSRALTRLAQLNQSKTYLFWQKKRFYRLSRSKCRILFLLWVGVVVLVLEHIL